jgi:hypothetical protein
MWTWCYHGSCKLVTLELHSSCFYIVVTLLHVYMVSHIAGCICYNSCDLSNNTHTCRNIHVYIVSHIVSCICCNLCDLYNNIHTCRNLPSCNKLQMVNVTQNPNCKGSCKSPHFFKMWVLAGWNWIMFLTLSTTGSTSLKELVQLC